MSEGDLGVPERLSQSPYEEALNTLSSLITRRTRADGFNKGDQFDLMYDYLKILELEGPISQMNVIHVAGTKGKGSTCAFAESILRHCGLRTGLFTSPHLIDVRERFRLDGMEVSQEKFLEHFWWCWDRLMEKTNDNVPMPTFFRFLALLAFKIFASEKVDVAILEVGLGGKFDATNVVHTPIVCGVASLGYDHMEILGNTLGEIAGEKAGIFKSGVPAFTVPQPEEAMSALERRASQLGISLQIASPLDISSLKGIQLGLHGEHQYLNAGLAIALCRTWLQKTGCAGDIYLDQADTLPEQFVKGLATTSLFGRAQIVPDPLISSAGLTFYLDGAHSPESMEMCGKWFSKAIKEEHKNQPVSSETNSRQILLFNCMTVRDPRLLLPPLKDACISNGIHFQKAIFVPNQSVFNKVGSYSSSVTDPSVDDLSWQFSLQKIWEGLFHDDRDGGQRTGNTFHEDKRDVEHSCLAGNEISSIFPSLSLAIKWLRDNAQKNRSFRYQVLVTGSLHLVGDVLKLLKK